MTFIHKGTQEPGVVEMLDSLKFDAVPAVVVIDARGGEVTRFVGVRSASDIEMMLKQATSR